MKKTLFNFILFFGMTSIIHKASSQIIFDAYFENGNTSEVDSKHEDSPGTTTVVDNPLKNADNPSNKVVRYRTTGSSERAEIRVDASNSESEFWYGWQIYIPLNWRPARRGSNGGGNDIIQQWHRGNTSDYPWAKGHPMTINISDDGKYHINWNYGGPNRVEKGDTLSGINANDDKGKWTHWAFNVKWAKEGTSGGFMRLYHNGTLVFSNDGPNWENMPLHNMWKAGIYHGNPSILDQDPYEIYQDNYIKTDKTGSLNIVNPYLFPTSQEEIDDINDINIFPNPCSKCNFIVCEEWLGAKLKISDFLGRIIYRGDIYSKKQTIEFSCKHSSLAIIKLEKDGESMMKKIVVK